MRIFVLEDDEWRMTHLRDNFFRLNDEVTHIESNDEHYRFAPPYDLILLDHDLGGRQLVQHEDSGLAFVRNFHKWMAGEPHGRIIIHSYNYDGAKAMAQVLADAGREDVYVAPFGSDRFNELLTEARMNERPIYRTKLPPSLAQVRYEPVPVDPPRSLAEAARIYADSVPPDAPPEAFGRFRFQNGVLLRWDEESNGWVPNDGAPVHPNQPISWDIETLPEQPSVTIQGTPLTWPVVGGITRDS